MPGVAAQLMKKLYGRDIWAGFQPMQTDGVQGWNGDHPSLSRLVASTGAKIVADVGVWKGQSTIHMAQTLRSNGIDGAVIAIDTFLGSLEHWSPVEEMFERINGMPDLYRRFLSNACNAGVQDYIVPLPQTSVTAAQILRQSGIAPSLVHIDAAHDFDDVLRDAEEYWPLLAPGGFLVGDDYVESWQGVVKGADQFSREIGVPLVVEAPKWIVQKPV